MRTLQGANQQDKFRFRDTPPIQSGSKWARCWCAGRRGRGAAVLTPDLPTTD